MTRLEELMELLRTYQQASDEAAALVTETRQSILVELKEMGIVEAVQPTNGGNSDGKRKLFGGNHTPTPVVDTETMEEYPSLNACGQALAHLVPEYAGKQSLVWYAVNTKFPGRFVRKSEIEQAVA